MCHRNWTIALVALLAAGCDNTPSTGVAGTYRLNAVYTTDTCAGQQGRSFTSEVTITRNGDNVTFEFGDEATLTGTFDPVERVMTVAGTILVTDPDSGGTFPGQMGAVARVTGDEINFLAEILFEGTFPGVSGTCLQEFAASGPRLSLSPFPLTGS